MPRNRHKKKNYVDPAYKEIADDMKGKVPEKTRRVNFSGGKKKHTNISLEIRPWPICVGLPMDELMFSQFFENYLTLDLMPWDYIGTTRSTYLPEARNTIHNLFLNELGGTHLLMLDSDVLPPPGFVKSLLAHDKPMVGGWYKKKEKFVLKEADGTIRHIQRPVVYDFVEEGEEKDWFRQRIAKGTGLERVAAAGAGCWLMRRDVAEALGENPYDMERGGEDLVLCKKVSDLGIPMYVDWDLACAHAGVFYV